MRSKHLHRRSNTLSAARVSRDTLRAAPERVFLVGVDYRTRASGERQPPHPQKKKTGGNAPPSISLPAEARAAREAVQPRSSNGDRARGFTAEDSLAELQELTLSAGAEVVGQFLQRREKPDPATLIGRGKLEEVAAAAASAHADLIIFDHELSPSQQRNIEHAAHRRILDRTQLILDIFARHARTREGQMQVELAQLQYLLPRLTGRGIEMSQLGGGIGTRGPGETQLETDRRRINRRIQHIKGQLENVRRIRGQQRQRRESVPVATVALVGYTNAGKSTLFNALTRANVLASSRMFATLDPTLRSVTLPSRRKILLSDTVGFIRNLPHTLVSAFRATLEEVQRAALILHVSDATSPNREVQDAQVEAVLRELSVYEKPRLMVLNKIDLLGAAQRQSLLDTEREVHVSAKQGIGLSTLLDRIDEMLREDAVSRVRLRVPQQEGKVLSLLEARARIFSRSYHDGLVEMEAQAPESLLRKLRPFVME